MILKMIRFCFKKQKIKHVIETLDMFKTLKSELEVFYKDKKHDVICVIDDASTPTFPKATVEYLKIFGDYENIRLVLDNFDEQQNYDELSKFISNSNGKITVFLFGDAKKPSQDIIPNNFYFKKFNDLVDELTKNVKNNTVIILSLTSANCATFKNFDEMRKIFRETISACLKKNRENWRTFAILTPIRYKFIRFISFSLHR
jgi:UDP-N-acetylmuramoylalanine-D-glutamate ligase